MDLGNLFRLQAWFSPAFPIGGYAYSHGLEAAVETRAVHDPASLAGWTEWILRHGSGQVDGGFLAAAYRVAPDAGAAVALADEARAWTSTAEMALESERQGEAFLSALQAAWPHPSIESLTGLVKGRTPLAVASGFSAAAHGIDLEPALACYLQSLAAMIVSAGVRLVPLGQTDGQKIMAGLESSVADATLACIETPLEELSTAALAADIFSMRHESQYCRIFRS
ncbi:MAG: urease accessory protein UreF [Rhodospirillaceae bacterium]|nr:urease accessory protein UreF [Rhodospirillaceae bacterium]MCY4311786.1 urease accessory protein UreF [Rhodospirillaceae bacterium]